jgi:hypothetical protein
MVDGPASRYRFCDSACKSSFFSGLETVLVAIVPESCRAKSVGQLFLFTETQDRRLVGGGSHAKLGFPRTGLRS